MICKIQFNKSIKKKCFKFWKFFYNEKNILIKFYFELLHWSQSLNKDLPHSQKQIKIFSKVEQEFPLPPLKCCGPDRKNMDLSSLSVVLRSPYEGANLPSEGRNRIFYTLSQKLERLKSESNQLTANLKTCVLIHK